MYKNLLPPQITIDNCIGQILLFCNVCLRPQIALTDCLYPFFRGEERLHYRGNVPGQERSFSCLL